MDNRGCKSQTSSLKKKGNRSLKQFLYNNYIHIQLKVCVKKIERYLRNFRWKFLNTETTQMNSKTV